METNYIAIIGLIAGTCTTISFLPQVIRTFRTKATKDISLSMYIILAAGLITWTVYGILIEAFPIILANSVSFVLAAFILILKLKYG